MGYSDGGPVLHYDAQLIEMKLASGMTNLSRLKDLADVLELIKVLKLPFDLGDQLAPYVQSKFQELWQAAQQPE